jgi:hypothetical protein
MKQKYMPERTRYIFKQIPCRQQPDTGYVIIARDSETDISELLESFEVYLIACGFDQDTVRDAIIDRAAELTEMAQISEEKSEDWGVETTAEAEARIADLIENEGREVEE